MVPGMSSGASGEVLWNEAQTAELLSTLRKQIDERLGSQCALVAIRRGGLPIVEHLRSALGVRDVGEVDIALYRDDAATALPDPKIGPSRIDFDVEGRDVIIVDDVLQTGRTIRAAIECLQDFGRPRRIWLAVLVDRGGRELPIAPDFCATSAEVSRSARLKVLETQDGLTIVSKESR